jgi:hypothetical protein
MEIGGISQVLIGGAWDFSFLGEEEESLHKGYGEDELVPNGFDGAWWLPGFLHSAADAPDCGAEEKAGRSGRDDNSRKSEEKSGRLVALDCKRSPFAKCAKSGAQAPSSLFEICCSIENPRGWVNPG